MCHKLTILWYFIAINAVIRVLYFLLPISRERIVFGSNFRNGDFDGFTLFKGIWISHF